MVMLTDREAMDAYAFAVMEEPCRDSAIRAGHRAVAKLQLQRAHDALTVEVIEATLMSGPKGDMVYIRQELLNALGQGEL